MGEKVSKIAIAGFRGATSPVEIILDPSKSVTLIFGENGTGKSTIADAIDFVCNRSFGSLENYSLGRPASKYIAALGCGTSNLKVTLVAGSKTWLATLSKDGVTVIPSTDCPDARVLRRKTILNLIEAQPRQRFEALRAFITVPNVEKSENALRETVKATEDSFNEAVRPLTHAEDELEKLWTTESKPGTSAIDWATTEAQKDLSELRGNVDKVARLEPAFHSVETALNALTRALAERKTAAESLAAAQTKQNVAGSSQMQQNAQLLGLLQDAQSYVTQNRTLSRCPICEQGIDSSELVKRLGERIAAMRELAELVSATGTARRQLDTKVSGLLQ